jgi:protease-4
MQQNKVSFGRVFWPSLLAVFIMTIIGLIIFFVTIYGIIGSFGLFGSSQLKVKENTVLHMKLNGQILERGNMEIDPFALNFQTSIGLSDILIGIEEAKKDSRIKGIFLELEDLRCGYSTARQIRKALKDFKSSGKFVVAYNSGELITQKEYYLSSAASEVYGFPTSVMEFVGLGTEISFYKKGLDMLGVEVQVVRGKNNDFKSAVEPFFRSEMSDSSRLQLKTYLSSMWKDIRNDIAVDRKLSISSLNNIADSVKIRRTADGVKYKLLDAILYRDQVIDIIRKKTHLFENMDVEFLSMEKYSRKKFFETQMAMQSKSPNIAVIVADGEISKGGKGINSNSICKLFQDVRKNSSIESVVFRINSPGGSALASEEIWREVKLTSEKMKVIVSMGDVAASGGYYIASPANYIFAEPTTITGSIGVFGLIPYTGKLLENKLGITFDRTFTNEHAVMSTNRKLTDFEYKMVQGEVDETYDLFLSRVAKGRKMAKDAVNLYARGRVWTGIDAKNIGLVDEIGGLEDAIKYAAKNSSITDIRVQYYPLVKDNPLANIIEFIEDAQDEEFVEANSKIPQEIIELYHQFKDLESISGIQMRLPYQIDIR